jgi:hypothetical protein
MSHLPCYSKPKPISCIPHWARPKLRRDQVLDLHIVHRTNLDVIQRGDGDETVLWDLVHAVLTYCGIARLRKRGIGQIEPQLTLCTELINRYRETGLVQFTPEQYEMAKHGADVMDTFAEFTDAHTADQAARTALITTDKWSAQIRAKRGQS